MASGRLANRCGPRRPLLIGQSAAAAGLLPLLFVGPDTPLPVTAVLLVPVGLGVGLALPPLTAAMMEAVPAGRPGLAAGVLNAARQVAGGLGVAAFGALVAVGFAAGLRTSLLVSVGLWTATAPATLTRPRSDRAGTAPERLRTPA
ncbi:MFS transporter [Streptomyces sp. NPDC003016]